MHLDNVSVCDTPFGAGHGGGGVGSDGFAEDGAKAVLDTKHGEPESVVMRLAPRRIGVTTTSAAPADGELYSSPRCGSAGRAVAGLRRALALQSVAMTTKSSGRRTSELFRAVLALSIVLSACASKPPVAPPETGEVQGIPVGGMLHDVEVRPVVTPSAVKTTIVNNTGGALEFRTAIQIVDVAAGDVVPAILGPKVAVLANTESPPWVSDLPPLPDGYHRVIVSAIAFGPDGSPQYEGGADDYLKRANGQTTVISFGEWNNKTGGAPVYVGDQAPPEGPSPGARLLVLLGVSNPSSAQP